MIGKFSVRKPYTVLVAVIIAIILGAVSFTRMTTDLLPNISLPYVIVMTTYVGASPETVETVVTEPVEAAMATVSNIENVSSTSSENYSIVILEFSQTADMNSVSLEIRESLDQVKSYWDEGVGSPIIMKMNPDMLPVIIAAVGGENMTYSEISQMAANEITPDLESLEGVASVSTSGLLEESVNVIIRQEKIDAINMQVFGYIEGEMADAAQELEDGKVDIIEGEKELNEAQAELDESRVDLADSRQELEDSKTELADTRKELEDSKAEIADGKAEIADGKAEMEDGKKQLEEKKQEAIDKLAEGEKELLTAKADLEAAKIQLTTEIATIEASRDGIGEMEDGIQTLEDMKTEAVAQIDSLITLADGIGLDDQNSIDDILNMGVITDPDEIAQLTALGDTSKSLADLKTELEAAFDTQIQELTDQVNDMKMALDLATVPLGVDGYLATLEASLQEVNDNIVIVDEAIVELNKGNLTAAIEIANAQTMIDLGEMQLNLAETQLEAGETQLEAGEKQLESGEEQLASAEEQLVAGEEQLESGQEQINDNLEQLKEAMEQIEEGEQELADAKADAINEADMHGILTAETVKALLAAQNFSMPSGYVTEDGVDYLVRVGDKPDDVEELKAMPLMNLQMEGVDIITLGNVADVFMTDNSGEIYANVNGNNGILLTIQKQTGYSTGEVSDRLLERFDEMMEENEQLQMVTFMDQGIYIDLVMNSIFNNIIFGAMLAIVILILFLRDFRPTLVIAFSIPISLVTAVVCMYFSGVTLNVISLSGLALGIGMLVDNSIVVIENIYRLRSEGYSMTEAAIEGTREVIGAVAASTLTTICVFAPIVFTEGITRQLFVDMGLTIAYSLVASLIIAVTVVPAMASKILYKTKAKEESKLYMKLMNGYEKLLRLSLRFKPVVLLLAVALVGVSAALSLSKGTAFMEDMDSPQMSVSLTMPKGSLLEQTARITDEVVERIKGIPEVTDVGANMGGSGYATLMGGATGSSTESTTVYILMTEDKERTNVEIAAELEVMLADIVEQEKVELSIQTSEMDISALGGSGITIQVQGRELDTLQAIAGDVADILAGVEGTTDVSDGMEESSGELRVVIDRNKAIEYGLTVAQVFQQIAARLAEATSSTALQTEIRDYDVFVRSAGDLALTRETLRQVEIDATDQDGKKIKVKLEEMAVFEDTISPDSVNRTDQTRYIAVSAAIAEGYNVGLVSTDVEAAIASYPMPNGYELVFAGENEFINEAMEQLMLMLILALMFMFLIMVAQFQSLLSPFIIMFTVPLAFTGGFFGLYLSNSPVSIIAVIGFVMLSGVIVNNGIVLIDYVNQLRNQGMNKYDALIEAGRTRLRPVLMTAMTTILAMSTMVFSSDMGSEMGRPMAIVTIGGLTYGTLLTLIVIPCIYDIFMREKKTGKELAAVPESASATDESNVRPGGNEDGNGNNDDTES